MDIEKAANLSQIIIDNGLINYFMGAIIVFGFALIGIGFFILRFMIKWDKESYTYRTINTMRVDEVVQTQEDHATKIDGLHVRVSHVEQKINIFDKLSERPNQ